MAELSYESFLHDPVLVWHQYPGQVPREWVQAAWDVAEVRDNLIYELVRSVRKNGDLYIAQGAVRLLSATLTAEQTRQVLLAIRAESHRIETEWRPEFEAAFQQHRDALPPPEATDPAE